MSLLRTSSLRITTTRAATSTLAAATTRAAATARAFSTTQGGKDLMDTTILTESQLAVREAVGDLCKNFPNSYWRERDRTATYPFDFHKALADGGWIGIALPEKNGGSGLGISEASVMLQTITESGAGFPGAQCTHANIYATQPLAIFGSEKQRSEIIPKIISGEYRTCFGVTEPNAGLNTLDLTTTATRRPDGTWAIKGQKIWITNALNAHVMMLLARTTPEDQVKTKAEGLTLFAIPMNKNAKGLEIRKIDKMGGNAVDSNEVWFDDYIVPGDTVIGDEAGLGKGFRMILHGMNAERCLVAAEALGIGYAALAKAAEYAGERVVFGCPIGKNQGIAHPLADAWAQLHAAACAVYHATRLYDAGLKDKSITPVMVGTAANTAKMLAAEASFNACQRAILAHGGMGYAKEFDVERMLRESFIPRIAPISREMVLNYISERVLNLPKSY